MPTFIATETFHHVSLFLTFLISKRLEISDWPALLLLLLFLLSLPLPLFLQFLLILFGYFLLFLLFFLGLPSILFFCYFFESLLQIEIADVLGGLVALDAIGEERPCVCVHHGIFFGILLDSQFFLFHLQNGHHFYLLESVNIEDVVFARWLLDQRGWWVASVMGLAGRWWLFF